MIGEYYGRTVLIEEGEDGEVVRIAVGDHVYLNRAGAPPRAGVITGIRLAEGGEGDVYVVWTDE